MRESSLMQRWVVRAAPAAKPWLPVHTSMLTKQAELSLLGGDFDHFDDSGGELLPEKEVGLSFHPLLYVGLLQYPLCLPVIDQ